MLLVINALGGGHTYTDTYTQILMQELKQFQETRCVAQCKKVLNAYALLLHNYIEFNV